MPADEIQLEPLVLRCPDCRLRMTIPVEMTRLFYIAARCRTCDREMDEVR